MATGDRIAVLRGNVFVPSGTALYDHTPLYPTGVLLGMPLVKSDNKAFAATFRVPTSGVPLSTGLTFELELSDDVNNPSPGKNVELGITLKRIVSGTSDFSLTGAAAEVLTAVTMPATSGVALRQVIAIANAALPAGLVAGDLVLISIRRNGGNVLDTHGGVVLLSDVCVSDT